MPVSTLSTARPHEFGDPSPSAPDASYPADWQTANTQGLMLAATGEWRRAAEMFHAAFATIEEKGHTAASAGLHSPLALVLSNLAQSLYHAGRVPEAIAHQERAVALRIAMTGEGSVAVARSRSDLAAMLGSVGRVEEAAVLARRALMAVESSGAPDMALAAVLANAARIAIVAGSTQDAEPILRRLHAVEARCGMDSAATDAMLERIGAAPITPPAGTPMLVDLDDLFPAPTSYESPAPAPTASLPNALAITHEIEFVDDVPTAAWKDTWQAPSAWSPEADEDPEEVGEYPNLPTDEAVNDHDVRTTRTWDAPELPQSGAYGLIEGAQTPRDSALATTGRGHRTQTTSVQTESVLERRVADRRRADLATRSNRGTWVTVALVVVAGVAATLAMLF